MSHINIYQHGLDKNGANYSALSPLSFLERAAFVYPDKTAQIHQGIRRTWRETHERCLQLASALNNIGITKGDTVAFVAPNIPELFEAHFGVPMAGAVLNAINTRLDAAAIAFILGHGEAKAVFVDREFSEVVRKAIAMLPEPHPRVFDIIDPYFNEGDVIGETTYDEFIATGDSNYTWQRPEDEWDAITLNYTSGTTGNPKGVVYHHRGAYLNAVNQVMDWSVPNHPTYLWTLPLFHCNGWCFPWAIAAQAGTNVFLRHVRDEAIFEAIKEYQVDHFCGAPIVLNMLNNADDKLKQGIDHQVKVMTAGAAPPAAVIEGMESLGFSVTHVYGLTEVYGPCILCAWDDDWSALPLPEQARLKARQGVKGHLLEDVMVADPATLEPVARDGKTLGEIFIRGNLVMKGYLKNPSATENAFDGDWFHTGDLAVWHADGYLEIKDRSKDIIITGGENVSSIEVEDVLYTHPKILEAAVVAKPHEEWGETPCAFVTPVDGATLTEAEIIQYCRERIAHFKAPKHVCFTALPKTSTGKIQKYVLRQKALEI